ncbi:uncharacterized protein LOC143862484 [Tasmannia lanceolata]|uniref:uncharacterized protein LOC143862484 n=1 Tax=Tasmannia lanceolata TaxID=3420 RepID=UPI004063956F
MKKLYGKGKVHPSAQTHNQIDHLALLTILPATILTLTAALRPEDREVLAYLISSSGNYSGNRKNTQKIKKKRGVEHPPLFHCNCFRCYTSFWVRWDSSPNRHLIHEILEAFEERSGFARENDEVLNGRDETLDSGTVEIDSGEVDGVENEGEKGPLRRFVSFIGESIWGVWNQ